MINLTRASLETTDIFKGAFYMCMGGDLADVQFRQNGKQIASFLFSGQDLHQHDKDYMNGRALVNPLQFREALNHLRDILFEKLRAERSAHNATNHAKDVAGTGRYENDRKRENRAYQGHY